MINPRQHKTEQTMANIKLYDEHLVAGHYLSYLINNDASGLDDDEIEEVNKYIKESLPPRHILDVSEREPSFIRCEVSGLWADCYKLEIYTDKDKD